MTTTDSPYMVLFWGSHPDDENDDCWLGEGFATLDEARSAFNAPVDGTAYCPPGDVAFVELVGPDVHGIRPNPTFDTRKRARDDAEWASEIRWQHRMAFGCDE